MTLDPVKISEKSALTAADSAAGDRFPVIDVSAGQLKTMTRAELATAVGGSTVTADRALVSNGSGAVAASAVTATELGRLSGVTSAVQTQLDAKAASSHSHAIGDVTNLQTTLDGKQASNANLAALAGLTGAADRVPYFTALATLALAVLTSFGRSLIAAADAAGVRSLLGLGTAAQSNTSDFAAASHTHAAADISDSTTAGRAVLTAADAAAQRTAIGLGAGDVVTFEKLIARQDGGVAGTDDVEISHDGTRGVILARSGYIAIRNVGDTYDALRVLGSGAGGFDMDGNAGNIRIFRDAYSTPGAYITPTGVLVGSDGALIFYSGNVGSTPDAALMRNAAGVVEVTNGTAGTFRDLAARHLLSSDFVRLATQVNNQTDAMADITGLSQALTALKKYAGRLVLIVTSATPAEGMKLDFGGTATLADIHAALTGNVQGATVVTSRYAGSGNIELSAFADADHHYLVFDVTISVTTAGTLLPRWAKTVDGDDLIVHAGSYFDLREVR